MAHQPGSSHLRGLFDSALQYYEKTTNITLARHPLAEQIHNCHAVEPTTNFLQEKVQEFGDFRGSDKVNNAIKNIVSILSPLSSTAILGDVVSPKVPLRVFHLSDAYSTAIPTCEGNTNWTCYSTCRMCPHLYFIPPYLLTSKYIRKRER